ncbi:hypothetical protein COOONC_15846 [Cooperia oncophora]
MGGVLRLRPKQAKGSHTSFPSKLVCFYSSFFLARMKRSAKIKLTEAALEKKVCTYVGENAASTAVETKPCDIEDLWKVQVR